MTSSQAASTIERRVRRLKLEQYGKCSRCSPHSGENAKRRNARKSKDRK